jgi:hypothetical protein
MGEHARVLPALLLQGTADVLNDFALGETMTRQWVGTDGLDQVPTSVEHHGLDASYLAALGTTADTCVRNRQFPCVSGLRGNADYPYSIEHHLDAKGCAVVDFWILHGLGHDYPGGDPAGSFTDPAGPDVTTASYDWMLRHRLGRPCGGLAGFGTDRVLFGGAGGEALPPAQLPRTGSVDGTVLGAAALLSGCGCRKVLRERLRRPHPLTKREVRRRAVRR